MRVVVAGGGIVGLTCAWWLLEGGHDVIVHDPDPGGGATHAAAGMIAPAGEAWFGEEALLRLGLASAQQWPAFADALDVGYQPSGTLLVGRDAADVAVWRRSVDLLTARGVAVGPPDPDPVLSDRSSPVALLPQDAQVQPREVVGALLARLGDRVVRTRVPERVPAGTVLVRCTGLAAHPALHPVRGEIVLVRCDDPPQRMIRGLVHGEPVYLVPRPGGEVVIGATSQARSGIPRPTVGGVLRLLDAARALVPALEDADLLEVVARDRPGSPDNGPLIGWARPGEIVAAGHYRSGVLLAPITAAAVLALVDNAPLPDVLAPFDPARFPTRSEEGSP